MSSTPQRRILHQFFWLQLWSEIDINIRRVPTAYNLADPLSRVKDFHSTAAAQDNTQHNANTTTRMENGPTQPPRTPNLHREGSICIKTLYDLADEHT